MSKYIVLILASVFFSGCASHGTTTVILKGDKKIKITEREPSKETVNKINNDVDDMKAATKGIIFYPNK